METQVPVDPPASAFVVLDIETAPDPRPLATVRSGAADRSTQTHVISAAALLLATRDDGGGWTVHALRSWNRPRDEHEILRFLQRALATELGAGATLVTFNGVRHDAPTIRRRAAFHRMFGLLAWDLLLSAPHRDLMTHGISGPLAQWASLAHTCAGFGIPTDHSFAAAAKATADVAQRKCETDVCATFALLLYTLAMEKGDGQELAGGWRALRAYVETYHAAQPHLMQFAHAAEDQCI